MEYTGRCSNDFNVQGCGRLLRELGPLALPRTRLVELAAHLVLPRATPSFYTVIGCHRRSFYTVTLHCHRLPSAAIGCLPSGSTRNLAAIAVIFCQNDSAPRGYTWTYWRPSEGRPSSSAHSAAVLASPAAPSTAAALAPRA
jgi:hypothetical protein